MTKDSLQMSGIFERILVIFLFEPVHLGETGAHVVHEPKIPQVLPSVYVAAENGFGRIVVANDRCLENLLDSFFKGIVTQTGHFVYRQPEQPDGDTVHPDQSFADSSRFRANDSMLLMTIKAVSLRSFF